jgi:hypothetical protein
MVMMRTKITRRVRRNEYRVNREMMEAGEREPFGATETPIRAGAPQGCGPDSAGAAEGGPLPPTPSTRSAGEGEPFGAGAEFSARPQAPQAPPPPLPVQTAARRGGTWNPSWDRLCG